MEGAKPRNLQEYEGRVADWWVFTRLALVIGTYFTEI
jgi:hypothetical protein